MPESASLPKTLMQLAGVDPKPHQPGSDVALILIDCQEEYTRGLLALSGVEAALDEAGRVLALARAAKAPVIHVQHKGKVGGAFDPESCRFLISEKVAPISGETVVTKSFPNAFTGTGLDDTLKALGVKNLIVVGFMSHMCVSSTVRSALDHGYGCTVVSGACATRDLPDGKGGVVSAETLHDAEMAALSDRFAVIVEKAEALSAA